MASLTTEDTSPPDISTLLESHRAALQLHCYRMTGSLRDAEDLAQETLLRAWRGYNTFQGRSSLRTWLYRIATNVCLDAFKKRRPRRLLKPAGAAADPEALVPDPMPEALWLKPFPDSELPATGATPEELVLEREHLSLAFLELLQWLPPRQRAILLLSDVLDWPAREIADFLESSVPAVEAGLHRARTALAECCKDAGTSAQVPVDGARLTTLLESYVKSWEANDLESLATLLHKDIVLSMPPFPAWYQGRDAVRAILALHPMGRRRRAGWHLIPTRANNQPAFALYRADQPGASFNAFGMMVLTPTQTADGLYVSALTIFRNAVVMTAFGFAPQAELHQAAHSM